jgi:hypothetical protein
MPETKPYNADSCASEAPTARVYVFADILRPGRNRSRRRRRWAWYAMGVLGLAALILAALAVVIG